MPGINAKDAGDNEDTLSEGTHTQGCHVHALLLINYIEDCENDSVGDMITSIIPTSWERIKTLKGDSLFEPDVNTGEVGDTHAIYLFLWNQWLMGIFW